MDTIHFCNHAWKLLLRSATFSFLPGGSFYIESRHNFGILVGQWVYSNGLEKVPSARTSASDKENGEIQAKLANDSPFFQCSIFQNKYKSPAQNSNAETHSNNKNTLNILLFFWQSSFLFFQLLDVWLQTEKEIGERYDKAFKISNSFIQYIILEKIVLFFCSEPQGENACGKTVLALRVTLSKLTDSHFIINFTIATRIYS